MQNTNFPPVTKEMLEPMYASLFALTNIDDIEVDNQAVTDSERFEIIQTIITTMVNLQRIDLEKVTNIYIWQKRLMK